MPERQWSFPRAFLVAVLGLGACAPPPDPTSEDVAAIQLAAATDIIEDIASNPGSIEAVCVGYEGDWEDPGLPEIGTAGPRLTYMDACMELDGRLVARDGGGQAISVSVGAPELTSDSRAEVGVYTSTGSVDLAVYSCSVRERDGAWASERCELEAIS
ncbi:MAG TPA: hypothetical protein VM198_01310 [Longimicrobiales bacterium]|nr:hypothetical protein [Longimicrobiales bacterium]